MLTLEILTTGGRVYDAGQLVLKSQMLKNTSLPLKAWLIMLQLRRVASHMWVMNKAEVNEVCNEGVLISDTELIKCQITCCRILLLLTLRLHILLVYLILVSWKSVRLETNVDPIFQPKKSRLHEVKWFPTNCTVRKWQAENLNPDKANSRTQGSKPMSHCCEPSSHWSQI